MFVCDFACFVFSDCLTLVYWLVYVCACLVDGLFSCCGLVVCWFVTCSFCNLIVWFGFMCWFLVGFVCSDLEFIALPFGFEWFKILVGFAVMVWCNVEFDGLLFGVGVGLPVRVCLNFGGFGV